MSFVNFDDFYDICCGMMEEEEVLVKNEKPVMERLELMNDRLPDGNLWWERALREIEKEKEKELFNV